MRKSKCAMPGCKEKGTRPVCDSHMQVLAPELRDKLMLAFGKMKAGRGADSLRIYSNTLNAARLHIERKQAESPAKPMQGALL